MIDDKVGVVEGGAMEMSHREAWCQYADDKYKLVTIKVE